MDISSCVGAAVRVLRQRAGISQEELAFRAGIDPTYLSGIERNRRNPTVGSLQVIVAALDTPLDVLFINARMLAACRTLPDRPANPAVWSIFPPILGP